MTHLSKTAAIRAARPMVIIYGRRTSWQVDGPYHTDKPYGPNTIHNADSYSSARAIRSQWVAEIALHLMGRPIRDIDGGPICQEPGGSINEIVNHYISELRQ